MVRLFNGPPMVVLHVSYRQKVLVILQKVKATSILRHTINISTPSLRVKVFQGLFFFQVSHPFSCYMFLV
jgi:hypothetical protein